MGKDNFPFYFCRMKNNFLKKDSSFVTGSNKNGVLMEVGPDKELHGY